MGPLRTSLVTVALLVPALLLTGGAVAKNVDVDESQVYYGNPAKFKKAGEISCDSVFREIPEYKKILEEGLTEGVRYEFLLHRANQKFHRALKTVHRAHGYDLIAELGAVRIEGKTVPDITSRVIEALPR
jgi:hypothetical protein